jgi:hypothetical protein
LDYSKAVRLVMKRELWVKGRKQLQACSSLVADVQDVAWKSGWATAPVPQFL